MKKIINNKIFYTILIILAFVAFQVFINYFFSNYNAFQTIRNSSMFIEIISVIIFIPILFIFKNGYIFTEKRVKFFKSILLAWPYLLYSLLYMVASLRNVDFLRINIGNIITTIILCLCIGIFEEFMCRGWLLNELIEKFGKSKKSTIIAVLISSIVFGMIHFNNYLGGQDLTATIFQIISAMFFGFSIGLIYCKTRNIWAAVFIHGFWDFAIMISSNIEEKCLTTLEGTPQIIKIMSQFMGMLPIITMEVIIICILFKKNIFSEELTIEKQKKNKKSRVVLSIILITIITAINVLVFCVNGDRSECPIYLKKEIKEYSIHYTYGDNENIEIEKNYLECNDDATICEEEYFYKFNISINNDNMLIIKNMNTNYEMALDYDDIDSLSVVNNDGNFEIFILRFEEQGYIVYRSDYISKENANDSEQYLNDFKDSFEQVILPNIFYMGYYQEKDNYYKYPLFVSEIGSKYILYPDGTIYILE